LSSSDDRRKHPAALLRQPRRAWRGASIRDAPSVAIAIAVLILLASAPQSHVISPGQSTRAMSSLSPRGTAFRPASMGLSAAPASAAPQISGGPNYDEQIGATFTQDQGSLEYNVTALAQADVSGYGPAYLLNGLSSTDYWYQVGVSYHWPSSNGGYDPTFGFSYQVFGPNGKPVYPFNGGAGLGTFSGVINSGDNVLLSLTFTGTSVQMLAQDWNTGATAKTSYSSEGSSSFIGNPTYGANSEGFFSGIMTEWYHASAYTGNEGEVTYTNEAVTISSAWLWIDEFDSANSNTPLFVNQTQTPVSFANQGQLYPFSAGGATIYGSAHQFITGMLNTTSTTSPSSVSSTITLAPATTEASSPSISATYTLAGKPQTAALAPGATVLEADAGTSITVSIASSGSTALDRWVFNGTSGTEITFPAGTSPTYVYYHLLREVVSYQVAGQGQALPASSELELTYQEAPPVASATPAQMPATQLLGITPAIVYALLGSDASIDGPIQGVAGERWAAGAQSWTITAADVIPDPIQLYHQYNVSVSYSIVGGGTPPEAPEFNSTAFGSPAVILLSSVPTSGWFDAGSSYSFTGMINGSTLTERWLGSGETVLGGANAGSLNGGPTGTITSPNESISQLYTHEYYADLGVNDASGGVIGGVVYQGSGIGTLAPGRSWFAAGSNLSATASANQGWQFEMWNGSGSGTYTGTKPAINFTVTGPLSENATFYPQLAISADAGTNIAYSYGSETGAVQAGTTKTLYVPPSANVTLRASPSLFVYSFASWQGEGLASTAKPSLAIVVDSPSAVTATSSYNYPIVLGAVIAAVVIILAVSLLIRSQRRKKAEWAFPQT
jgi:hypothetical protein